MPPPFPGAAVQALAQSKAAAAAAPGPAPESSPSREPKRSLRESVRAYRWDFLLFMAAGLCFGQFLFTNTKFEREYASDTIAVVKAGAADRRSFGSTSFVAVSVKSELRNLDSVWVKKGAKAVLELYDGSELELGEKTLITLKKPFKASGRASERVQVVKGKVIVKEGKEVHELTPNRPGFSEIPEIPPEEKGAPVPESRKIKATPGKNSVVYLRAPRTAEVGFAWPKPVTGFLSLVREGSRDAQYVKLESRSSAQAVPGGPGTYVWQVVDGAKRVVVGPFRFIVKDYGERSAESLVRDALEAGSGDSIDVRW